MTRALTPDSAAAILSATEKGEKLVLCAKAGRSDYAGLWRRLLDAKPRRHQTHVAPRENLARDPNLIVAGAAPAAATILKVASWRE